MQANTQEEIDPRTEPSPMAIIGAILAQGALLGGWIGKKENKGPLRKVSAPLSRYKTE